MRDYHLPLAESQFLNLSPSAGREQDLDELFRVFRRRIFHNAVSGILEPLKPGMLEPVILRCPDGHCRRVIFGLGPYIADYPEQVLVTCVKTGGCPK